MNKFLFNMRSLKPMMEADGAGTGGTGDSSVQNDKTFTQEDLNRIAAQEKRQGISSVLKTLGFESENDAKAFVEKYRQAEDDKKDDLEKAQESLKSANTARAEAEAKADAFEKELSAIKAGVPAEYAGDVVLLAKAKAVDGKSFEDALEEVKKAHPSLFESTEGSSGTGGNSQSHQRRNADNSTGDRGKRLAEKRRNSSDSQNKKSYFSN